MKQKATTIDLGALQKQFETASRALKAAKSKLNKAQDNYDVSVQNYANAEEAMRDATRTILNTGR